jgi:1,4-dihydroxy-2-naphthoate octaprenyltransferase
VALRTRIAVSETLRSWILATRPRTLPACIGPVLLGNALAFAGGAGNWLIVATTLFCALTLQVSVNLANDYFDGVNGIDQPDRLGPVRVTQSGLLAPATVRNGMLIALGVATASGLYLVWAGGWPLLVAGLLAIVALLAYSGGPYPLASHGLGDAAVFVFYGPVAVAGTDYAHRGTTETLALWLSVAVVLPIVAVLVVNNLRDIPTDARAGKRTLAVRIGPEASRRQFAALMLMPFAMILVAPYWLDNAPLTLWLGLLALPRGIVIVRRLYRTEGAALNMVLAQTASFSMLLCVLLGAGVLLA